MLPNIPYSDHSNGIYVWKNNREYDSIPFPLLDDTQTRIRLSPEFIRNMDVWFYGISHKLKVELQFWEKHKKPITWDYFSCMSACYVGDNLDIVALNHSGKHTGKNNFCNTLLLLFQDRLKGVPYAKSPVTNLKFSIGNCAEQNAANDILKYSNCKINELVFSKAIRPRTMCFVPPCQNCRLLFPQI